MSDNSSSSSDIGLCGLLGVLFIGLKLTGYVDWAWGWVLAPLWIPWGIVLLLSLVAGGILIIGEITKKAKK